MMQFTQDETYSTALFEVGLFSRLQSRFLRISRR